MQNITNLSANGFPDAAIKRLLEEGLLSEIEPLIHWTGPNFRVHLAKAIENAGGLMGGRRGRQAGLEALDFTLLGMRRMRTRGSTMALTYKDGQIRRGWMSNEFARDYAVRRITLTMSPVQLGYLKSCSLQTLFLM